MTVAVNAAVKRFYRVYIEAPDDASTETIETIARRYILDASPEELEKQTDPDLDIEPHDITGIEIDYDSISAMN